MHFLRCTRTAPRALCCCLVTAGESTPLLRRPGSSLHAGTLNVGSAALLMETTAAAGDTAVARMAALVEAAASQQSPAETMVAQVGLAELSLWCNYFFFTARPFC